VREAVDALDAAIDIQVRAATRIFSRRGQFLLRRAVDTIVHFVKLSNLIVNPIAVAPQVFSRRLELRALHGGFG
jgi:hypothetical protein